MKGYKAFNHDMTCRGKQYAENTVFEEEEAEICRKGMHFCADPLECLNYYPLLDNDMNLVTIAEVEALDEAKTDDNRKFCTKKLRVGAKLDLKGIVNAQIEFVKNTCKGTPNFAQGDYSNAAAQGDSSNAAAQGYSSNAAAQGNYSNAAAQGDSSNAAAQGDSSNAAAQGYSSNAAAQGNYSKASVEGTASIAAAFGKDSVAKASLGCWIVLSEHGDWNGKGYPVIGCVAAQIDGENLKSDTWYTLKNGVITEVAE